MLDRHTLIIAEAGVNYNGDINIAKEMIAVAAEAGADIVKFQTAIPENVISKYAAKAEYQKKNTNDIEGNESQLDMVRHLLLPWDVYGDLVECCKENNIQFLSTPFDIESARFLRELGMHVWKIPSGEITNLPYLREIASYGEPIIMSTGMSTLDEIADAVDILKLNGCAEITLMQCNTAYPSPFENANLNAMRTIKERFGCDVGYSDHTKGIEVPIAAVAMGATVIEKHFTLDVNMEGPDQQASIEPDEFSKMVSSIRNIEKALGCGIKEPSPSERNNIAIARKSIVAKKSIAEGEVFCESNITCKRPGDGISPMKWDELLGKKAKMPYEIDEKIKEIELA